MPKFYLRRITPRLVYEYYVVEAPDQDTADELYDRGRHTHLGDVIGNRIKWLDDQDEFIAAEDLPANLEKTA